MYNDAVNKELDFFFFFLHRIKMKISSVPVVHIVQANQYQKFKTQKGIIRIFIFNLLIQLLNRENAYQ